MTGAEERIGPIAFNQERCTGPPGADPRVCHYKIRVTVGALHWAARGRHAGLPLQNPRECRGVALGRPGQTRVFAPTKSA
jgi:hypothetical protein